MTPLNAIDIVLGIILLLGFYVGFKKGLFVALASLVGIVVGVYGAVYFSDFAADYISSWFDWSEQLTNLVAFAVTFFAIVSLVSLAGKLLTKMLDFAALGIFNKLLGGVFNLVKYAFMISVLFMFLNASTSISGYVISEEKKANSILYAPIASLAPLVIPFILEEVETFRSEDEENEVEEEVPIRESDTTQA